MSIASNLTAFVTTLIAAINARSAPGPSDYQMWLAAGNTGTMQDYRNAVIAGYTRTAATLAALPGMLAGAPEGSLVTVQRHAFGGGSLYHQASVWQKDQGKWSLAYGTSVHVYGEAAGAQGITDLITFGNALDTFRNNNASSFNGYGGERLTSGQSFEVRKLYNVGWIGWESPWLTYTPTIGGAPQSAVGSFFRYASGKVRYEGYFNATGASTAAIIVSLPVNARVAPMVSGGTSTQSGVWATGRANGYVNSGDYDFAIAFVSPSVIGFRIPNTTSRIVETVGNSIPVAWVNGSQLRWVLEYDQA